MPSINDINNAINSIHDKLEQNSRKKGEDLANSILSKIGISQNESSSKTNSGGGGGFNMHDSRFIKKKD